MKQLLLILLLVGITSCEGISQVRIEGTVVDNFMGQPQDSVIVEIAGQKTMTNKKGVFSFDNVKPGDYTLTIKRSHNKIVLSQELRITDTVKHSLHLKIPPDCPYDPKAEVCPICRKADMVVPILYGFPSEEMFEASENGEIMLGGCEVTDCDPQHYCQRDKKEF